MALRAPEDEPERGRGDEPGDRPSLRHHSDVDRVFAEAGDEFLRSVERVDDRKTLARRWRAGRALLRNDGDARKQAREALADEGVGGLVGGGDGRPVRLQTGAQRIRRDREDGGRRPRDQLGQLADEIAVERPEDGGFLRHQPLLLALAGPYRPVYHRAVPEISPESAPHLPAVAEKLFMAVTLESLDLAALLCSRVCHDLISPAGAIVNGLEVLEESDDEETKTFALTLIKKSARTATARLQFCRIAFGAAGSITAQVDTGDAEQVARGFIEDEKVKLTWNL